ncbi:MAG: alpha-hydroxy-acid oxidizing protein [Spirochaetia bacterium]|nr:alpha-hydroxy-acid oxidizing protein [Spirochaetia bacterium]
MKRNLIVIGAGFLQVPLIQTAKNMGLRVLAMDMSANAPGMKLADTAIIMSTKDTEGCVREAKRLAESRRIHGVVTAGTDASRAVAAIAGALELPGIRYADAEAASNKVLMRKRLERHGVPIPRFFSVWSIKEARDAMDELTFPLVIKPADNMGARGVIKVRNRNEIYAAFRHAKRHSPSSEMILEEYMAGPELSVDALAFQGQIRITGVADRIIAREPFFVELGHNMPSNQPASVLAEAEEVMKQAMRALGIHTGAGKGDLKITPDGVKVGEVAARLSGGFMSSHTYPLHSGVNLLRAAIQISLGDIPDALEPTQNLVAIERSIMGPAGKIVSITGAEELARVPGVHAVHFNRQPGDILPEATSNIDKAGHIIVVAPTLPEAEAIAKEALSKLTIVVDDTFSVNWKEIEERARARLGEAVCWVCKQCDGSNCASGVPGMGGVGNMNTFKDNSRALAEFTIVPRYIRQSVNPDTTLELFGRKFEHPILGAPMTGALTNMHGAISEFDFARSLLTACRETGSIAMVGDGASPEKYLTIMQALEELEGFGIAIFKPRADTDALLRRLHAAESMGLVAVGMDIDAIQFKTMELQKQSSTARDFDEICRLRDATKLPFILKGIMSPDDADRAARAGISAIIVSNHGGRVLDDMPGTARVLPAIVDAVGGRIPVLADGGVRTGQDAFKLLALGADAVLVGRPLAIAAVGGDSPAVKFLLTRYREELARTMGICGAATLGDIQPDYLLRQAPLTKDRSSLSGSPE